jgi:hypothetical protein
MRSLYSPKSWPQLFWAPANAENILISKGFGADHQDAWRRLETEHDANSRPMVGDYTGNLFCGRSRSYIHPMPIRIIPHEESIEVRFPDGRDSKYFYFDDNPGRRSINGRPTREAAVEAARALARAERGF